MQAKDPGNKTYAAHMNLIKGFKEAQDQKSLESGGSGNEANSGEDEEEDSENEEDSDGSSGSTFDENNLAELDKYIEQKGKNGGQKLGYVKVKSQRKGPKKNIKYKKMKKPKFTNVKIQQPRNASMNAMLLQKNQ